MATSPPDSLPDLRYPSPVIREGDAATAAAASGSASIFQQAQAELRAEGQRRRLELPGGDGLPSVDESEYDKKVRIYQARVAFHESLPTQNPQEGQAQSYQPQGPPYIFGGATRDRRHVRACTGSW